MKHLFRFLFTGAILLVSLLIFNNQKGEYPSKERENPDTALVELHAEICFTRIASSSILSFPRHSPELWVISSDQIKDTEFLMRQKIQMHIHQEIKPDLSSQSGTKPLLLFPFEDPLLA